MIPKLYTNTNELKNKKKNRSLWKTVKFRHYLKHNVQIFNTTVLKPVYVSCINFNLACSHLLENLTVKERLGRVGLGRARLSRISVQWSIRSNFVLKPIPWCQKLLRYWLFEFLYVTTGRSSWLRARSPIRAVHNTHNQEFI